jgi:asparagine synthase (glutamine-hydrolysing)
MCGVAGIIKLDSSKVEMNALIRFTDSISHRGPDGSGYELLENDTIGFGHRRLSILDLSEAGKQPMYSNGKELCITFNGEIYNFIEIRNELKVLGFKFKTETDTEVILAAYKYWGKSCLNRFNGMFAIIVWDSISKELFIARDRFGVKPLYYLFIPGKIFAFCSETIGFKNLDDYRREIDNKNLNIALYDSALLEGSDKTIFKNIYQLLSGNYLLFNLKSDLKTIRWWNTKDELREVPKNYNEQVEEFKALFESACKLRLRSDVPIASALSGGLDSSSVYATIHKINKNNLQERSPNNWQKAFVATFPNTKVDERQYAEKVIQYVGGNATYIIPDYSKLAYEVVAAAKLFDGIISTPINAISDVYKSMRLNGITVSMDGHGVDEMMYGYNTYVYKAFYYALQLRDFVFAEDLVNTLCGLNPNYKKADLLQLINNEKSKSSTKQLLSSIKKRFTKNTHTERYQQSWIPLPDTETINTILSKEIHLNNQSPAENLLYKDFHYVDLPINLRDFDRASMQHGIEIRMPFMDYRLVSYVFSLPISSKIGNGFTKKILRDAMVNTLPEEIRTRTFKIGIGGPDEWYTNQLKPMILDVFNSKDFLESQYWNGKEIAKHLETGYQNNSLTKSDFNFIWGLVSANFVKS